MMLRSDLVDISNAKPAALAEEVVVFDFLSHENMHHAFNEGYLRTLAAAFPDSRIALHALAGQIERLAPRLSDVDNIDFHGCDPFLVPFGMSRHNPVGGRLAARRCFKTIKGKIAGRQLRLVALLGVEANLWAMARHHWPTLSSAPLHMILHSQLGDAMVWRSRNPIIRATDMVAQVKRPLPSGVNLVALELGIKQAIVELSPAMARSVITLEHSILLSEWSKPSPEPRDGKIRIAFLGHARRTKGFQIFVELATNCARPDIEFHAIGLSSYDTSDLDLHALSRSPSPTPLSRHDYLEGLTGVDLVCLPLHNRAYDFCASGTLSDAIAALKPMLAIRNRAFDAIVDHYGPIGHIVDTKEQMAELIRTFDYQDFLAKRPQWIANLTKIREARRPEGLARSYPFPLT